MESLNEKEATGMYECLLPQKAKTIGFLIYAAILLFFFLVILIIEKETFRSIVFWIIYIPAAAFLLCVYKSILCDYRFDKDHFWIKYPFEKWIEYTWDDFQEIGQYFSCVSDEVRTPDRPALLLIRKDAKKRKVMGGWPLNNFFKYRKIISLSTDQKETLEALKKYSPLPIHESPSVQHKKRMLY